MTRALLALLLLLTIARECGAFERSDGIAVECVVERDGEQRVVACVQARRATAGSVQ